MGTCTTRYPLSDEERRTAARQALADGTATRVRVAAGWSPAALAERLNVTTTTVHRWEAGVAQPAPASALKLWRVLVDVCRTPPA